MTTQQEYYIKEMKTALQKVTHHCQTEGLNPTYMLTTDTYFVNFSVGMLLKEMSAVSPLKSNVQNTFWHSATSMLQHSRM